MIDLGYYGSHYTWGNNKLNFTKIWKRIDNVFSFENWLNYYSISTVTYLMHFASNHCPLLIDASNLRNSKPRSFNFEIFLLSYTLLERMI